MNMRRNICKKFDEDSKGFVTIEDIFEKLPDDFILFGFMGFSLTAIFILTGNLYYSSLGLIDDELHYDLYIVITGFLLISFGILIIYSIYRTLKVLIEITKRIYENIKNLKIVVCPLKKE